ncbi:hypothetical protein [Thiohalocapsa marina]|uniref:hypothetical protein n=1 Tax=Thiohalocapsa marina TaxID=424902 RepID=UPI0036DF2507
MSDTNGAMEFTMSIGVADQLIDNASKEQVAEAARVLAITVGYYEQRFGAAPSEALQAMLEEQVLDKERMSMVTIGMRNLISVLAEVSGLTDDLDEAVRH